MFIGSVSAGQVSAAVWAATTRQLTSIAGGCSIPFSGINTVLAAASLLDLRPAGSRLRQVSIMVGAATGAPALVGVTNGIASFTMLLIPISNAGGLTVVGNSTVGPCAGNFDAVNTVNVTYGGWDWN